MARKAVINGTNATSGTVENVILADDSFTLSGKTLVMVDTAGPGWTWNGGSSFTAPPSAPHPIDKRGNFNSLIQRRASVMERNGDVIGALLLLKQYGA